jgi:hypothetical protein
MLVNSNAMKPNMTLGNVTNKLDTFINRNLDKKSHDKIMNKNLSRLNMAVRPMVIQFLLINYAKSGLGMKDGKYEQTGHLRNMISQSNVLLSMKNGEINIKISMPSGAAPFENQENGDENSFYKAAQSLNSGWVPNKDMTRRQKKAYKKRYLGDKLTRAEENRIADVDEDTSSVVAPRPYYYLDDAQLSQISKFSQDWLNSNMND